MKNLLAVVLALAALAACARAESTMMDSRTAMISGRGSAFDSSADVMKATLQEAAQATTNAGYRYFTLESAQDQTRTSYWVQPGTTTYSGSASGYSTGYGTAYGTYSGTAYSSPGSVTPLVKPGMDVMISMYRPGEIDPQQKGVFDAEEILSTTAQSESAAASPPPTNSAPASETLATSHHITIVLGDGTIDRGRAEMRRMKSSNSGNMELTLASGTTCDGQYAWHSEIRGDWAVSCSDGLIATGSFESDRAQGRISGYGQDTDGRRVSYTLTRM